MKGLYPLRGIVSVLNTPFDRDNKIALKALRRNTENALTAGVAGFLVPAMASEVHKLSHTEKLSMVETVLETVNGRVPVFAGSGSTTVEESKKIIKSYLNLGCKHVLIQLPHTTDQQFKNDFNRLADLGPEVIMLQDWDAEGYGLSDELITELFHKVQAFRCLKVETVPAGTKYSRILELTEGNLNVSGGWAVMQMPEALKRGVHAFMPTAMHRIYVKIYNDYRKGKEEEALRLFNELLPVLAFSNQHLNVSIYFFKRLLWKQGIYPTPKLRTDISFADKILEETADRLIAKVSEIELRTDEQSDSPITGSCGYK